MLVTSCMLSRSCFAILFFAPFHEDPGIVLRAHLYMAHFYCHGKSTTAVLQNVYKYFHAHHCEHQRIKVAVYRGCIACHYIAAIVRPYAESFTFTRSLIAAVNMDLKFCASMSKYVWSWLTCHGSLLRASWRDQICQVRSRIHAPESGHTSHNGTGSLDFCMAASASMWLWWWFPSLLAFG